MIPFHCSIPHRAHATRPAACSLAPRSGHRRTLLCSLGLALASAGCGIIVEIPVDPDPEDRAETGSPSTTGSSTDTGMLVDTGDTDCAEQPDHDGCPTTGLDSSGDDSSNTTPMPPVDPSHCQTPLVEAEGGMAEDSMEVPMVGPIADLHVLVRVAHEGVGDLQIFVEHEGIELMLLDHPLGGACEGNHVDAMFDDDAEQEADQTCAKTESAIAGPVFPTDALSTLDGLEGGGEWTLRVVEIVDPNEPETLSLESWCVVLSADGPLSEG